MSKNGSIAPMERINITYQSLVGNAREEIELPLRILVLSEFYSTNAKEDIENRLPVSIHKENFNRVMKEQNIQLKMIVPDRLQNGEREINMRIDSLDDFKPDAIASQIPELRSLLEIRSALCALRGPIGNSRSFREKITEIASELNHPSNVGSSERSL